MSDDGTGFDPAWTGPGTSGLRTMRERADAVGATFAIDSAPGRGSTVIVTVPLPR